MAENITSHDPSACRLQVGRLKTAIAVLYFTEFPVALLLNGVALCVACHLRSTSTFIVYLKNLLAADLLLTLTLPLMAAGMLPGAAVGLKVFTCRVSDVIFYGSLYASISLMGLISLDRFFKIVRPRGRVLGQTVLFSVVMCLLVWAGLIGGTVIPTMVLTDLPPDVNSTGEFCMSLKRAAGIKLHTYVVLSMEGLFWLVSVLIVCCYICITLKVLQSFRNSGSNNSQGKKKTKLRVFLILLVFFVCFVPLHIFRVPFTLGGFFRFNLCKDIWVEVIHDLCLWVSTTNACLDPVLYILLCREFREKLVVMMKAAGIGVQMFTNENDS